MTKGSDFRLRQFCVLVRSSRRTLNLAVFKNTARPDGLSFHPKPVTFPPQATNTMKSLSGSPTSETANTSLASINRFSVPSSSTVTPAFQPASPFGARTSSTSPPEDQVAQQRRVCTIIDSALALAEEESDLRGDF